MQVVFPAKRKQRYWNIHYRYMLSVLYAGGARIQHADLDDTGETSFQMQCDGKQVLVDFSNAGNVLTSAQDLDGYDLGLKYRYKDADRKIQNCFPFATVSFCSWPAYRVLSRFCVYNAGGNRILNNQRIYGNAIERRFRVQRILRQRYGDAVSLELTNPVLYWWKIRNCLVSVHVPGYCNNSLDRAQLQLMAYGACTVSPFLPEWLPFNRRFQAGVNYIACSDDYGNLIDCIEWAREHRQESLAIGHAARDLFREVCTPRALVAWLEVALSTIGKKDAASV